MPVPLTSLWKTLGERPLVLALALVLLGAGVWLLVGLPGARSAILAMDEAVLLAFRSADDLTDPIGSRSVEEGMRDITALGGVTVTTVLLFVAVGFVALAGRTRTALYLLVAIGSGIITGFLLKSGFDRPRPELVPHGAYVMTSSFPSGHASTAAVLYLTLGAALSRVLHRPSQRVLVMSVAVLLAVAVGVSRVYLGVHYPTDVLAGWFVGGGWAAGTWTLERALQRRGLLEPAPANVD